MTRVDRRGLASVTPLLAVSAVLELGAGVTMLAAPATIVRLLLGDTVDVSAAAGIGRITGAALCALGAACWWARHEAGSAATSALARAMLIYNATVVALVLSGALGALGLVQWTAVAVHTVQAIWCAWVLADTVRTRAETA